MRVTSKSYYVTEELKSAESNIEYSNLPAGSKREALIIWVWAQTSKKNPNGEMATGGFFGMSGVLELLASWDCWINESEDGNYWEALTIRLLTLQGSPRGTHFGGGHASYALVFRSVASLWQKSFFCILVLFEEVNWVAWHRSFLQTLKVPKTSTGKVYNKPVEVEE